MSDVMKLVAATPMVAIVRLADLSEAVEVARALIAGGVTVLEFTLSNRDAIGAITAVKAALPQFADGLSSIGAGTVTNVDDARAVIAAGAQFIVTPTLNLDVIREACAAGVPIMPGAYTPTEILTAWEAGASVVKVFPARALGAAFVSDLLSALPYLRLMPTGGVGLNNLADYLKAGAVAVGVGGSLVDAKIVAAHDWPTLTAAAREYVTLARQHAR